MQEEKPISIEWVRIPGVRESYGSLNDLGESIRADGLHRPITVWEDGTLVSGGRRLRAYFLLAGEPRGGKYRHIPAIIVDTIEDAAKFLFADNQDEAEATPLRWSEVCALWEVLRTLDEPAAARRRAEALRRGVELRKAAMSGKRAPGRSPERLDDYIQHVLSQPFGLSEQTGSRMRWVWRLSQSTTADPKAVEEAKQLMRGIDDGMVTIWAAYAQLGYARKRQSAQPKIQTADHSAAVSKQRSAWDRALPQLEGLLSGLAELGPVNPAIAPEHLSPAMARFTAIRRTVDQIVKQMKEIEK